MGRPTVGAVSDRPFYSRGFEVVRIETKSGRSEIAPTERCTVLLVVLSILLFAVIVSDAGTMAAGQQPLTQQDAQAILNQYCVTCHNQRAKTANLELDAMGLSKLDQNVVAWEAVVRKLRTGMMPPKTAPRPNRSTLDGLAAWLETGLDQAARLHPNPGSPSLQRMNRN